MFLWKIPLYHYRKTLSVGSLSLPELPAICGCGLRYLGSDRERPLWLQNTIILHLTELFSNRFAFLSPHTGRFSVLFSILACSFYTASRGMNSLLTTFSFTLLAPLPVPALLLFPLRRQWWTGYVPSALRPAPASLPPLRHDWRWLQRLSASVSS